MSRKKKILFACLVPLILFSLIEIGFRIRLALKEVEEGGGGTHGAAYRKAGDPYLGYRVPSGANEQGFRGPTFSDPKAEDAYRIFCVGGSSTYGFLVDAEKAYPTQLDQILQERFPNRTIEVVNAGVPGYHAKQSLVNIQVYLSELEPDVVVFLHGNNDLIAGQATGYAKWSKVYEPYRKDRVREGESDSWRRRARAWARWLLNKSVAIRTIEYRVRRHQLKHNKAESLNEEGVAAYRKNLENVVRWSKEAEVPVLFLTYPNLYGKALEAGGSMDDDAGIPMLSTHLTISPLTLEALVSGIEKYNGITRSIARKNGVPVFDLANALPEEQKWFLDPIHFSPEGCRRVAELVAEALSRHGLTPK